MSQVIGRIFEQSWPDGQQMAEAPLLKALQVVPAAQQKSPGSPCPHAIYPATAQEARGTKSSASAVSNELLKAITKGGAKIKE